MSAKYIPLIDYLKAFAILMVTTTHFFTYDEKDFFLFTYVIQMGMPVFMLLLAFNSAMSNDRHGRNTLGALYAPGVMLRSFKAILPSYALMFLLEALARGAFGDGLSLWQWVYAFVTGGLYKGSHGGYFFAIYWQYLLVAPLIYVLMRRWPRATLVGALLTNMVYEFLVGAWDIPRLVNRLLFARYLFIAVSGQYLYFYRRSLRLGWVLVGMAFSLAYITAIDSFDFWWPLNYYWRNTCVYASFYYIGLVALAFRFFEEKRLPGRLHEVASTLGRSTWHIYLTQMLYFRLGFAIDALPLWPRVAVGLVICSAVGVAWHYVERSVTQTWRKKRA